MEITFLKEALFSGMTANAFKLGTVLTLGWFWPRVDGCSVLYRGGSVATIDFDNILDVAALEAGQISPPSYVAHSNNSTQFYLVRKVNGCGYLERTLKAAVKITIDAQGNLAVPEPNSIFDATITQTDADKAKIVWYYCPLDQNSEPTCFNIYYDSGTGQIDYENPIATINYAGRKFYSYTTDSLDADEYIFAVKAQDADGVEDSSLGCSEIQINPLTPDAIEILSTSVI